MKFLLLMLITLLERICCITHHLPDPYEENLQLLFIKIFGYHCPFVVWSFWIDTKFKLGFWRPTEAARGKNENKCV
jgi:hypothetical protein